LGSSRKTIRLDNLLATILESLAELEGVSLSSLVRYHLRFSLALHDPDLTLELAMKEQYKELLKRDPELLLKIPVIDLLKPLSEIIPYTILKDVGSRGNQNRNQE
jgi:chromatin remodeling complex protein RSC6